MPQNRPVTKHAGRRLGSPNRDSFKVREILQSLDFDSIKEFVQAFREIDDPIERARLALTIARFEYPIPTAKPVEDQPPSESAEARVQTMLGEFRKLTEERKAIDVVVTRMDKPE